MSTTTVDQKKPLKVHAVDISILKEAEYNPRKITDKELQDIQNSIKEFGVVEPIVVNRFKGRENVIIGGHQRIKAFKNLGPPYVPMVPVVYVSLTYEKEKRLNVRLNKNTGQFDFQKLIEEFEMDELLDIGFEEEDFPDFEILEPEETEGDDEIPEKVPAITVKGDLYELGDHRVLCGDSTVISDVELLMNGEKSDMVFTDPPYGVGFDYNSHDDNDENAYFDLCENIYSQFSDTKMVLVTCGQKRMNWWLSKNPADILIWYNASKCSPGKAYHVMKNEIILLFGKCHNKYNSDHFHYNSELDNNMKGKHPCPKPVELISDLIRQQKEVSSVLDYFLGSGSTLIACEKTKRKCYGMEIDEKYCDVIVKRYVDFCKKNERLYSVKRNGEDCKDFD